MDEDTLKPGDVVVIDEFSAETMLTPEQYTSITGWMRAQEVKFNTPLILKDTTTLKTNSNGMPPLQPERSYFPAPTMLCFLSRQDGSPLLFGYPGSIIKKAQQDNLINIWHKNLNQETE